MEVCQVEPKMHNYEAEVDNINVELNKLTEAVNIAVSQNNELFVLANILNIKSKENSVKREIELADKEYFGFPLSCPEDLDNLETRLLADPDLSVQLVNNYLW